MTDTQRRLAVKVLMRGEGKREGRQVGERKEGRAGGRVRGGRKKMREGGREERIPSMCSAVLYTSTKTSLDE